MATVTTSTTLTATDTVTVVNATDVTASIVITLSTAALGSRHLITRMDNKATVSCKVIVQGGNSVNGETSVNLPVGGRFEFISDKASSWTSLGFVAEQTLASHMATQNDILSQILEQLRNMG